MAKDDQVSRRDMLRNSLLAAGAAAVPKWARSIPFDPQNPIILGEGAFRYECHHDWLKPAPSMVFGDTHGVAQSQNGDIFICHTVNAESKVNDAVCVYNKSGKLLRTWGSEFKGGAHGLDIRKENGVEYLYHCDTNRQVIVKTDLQGNMVWQTGVPKQPGVYDDKHRFVPTNVAFLPDGDFLVGDGYGSSYIHRYSRHGIYKSIFAKPGKDEGFVNCPHGLFLDPRGKDPLVVVADRSNNRLQYFDLEGKYVKMVTTDMRQPCHFHFRDGHMLVPHLASVVEILDEDNKKVAWLGDGYPEELRGHPKSDFHPGKFVHPHSAKFLQNGDIVVVEWVPQGRITLLKHIK